MAYRADIEIAVKGTSQLTNLTKQLESASNVVNRINKELAAKGLFTGSIENLRNVSAAAERTMRSAAAGTYNQKQAIDVYVKSLANAEKAELNLAAAIKQRQRELGMQPAAAGMRAGGGRLGGVASNAIIGGAFPLLFGQGGGAAAGGAIGGAVGGLFGGTGGFAGSLLGTLLGQIAGQANQVKELGADIGFTAEQTQMLGDAFKKAGADFAKFQDSVQNIRGLSLSVEEQANAIRLVSQLTETYGGKIDKVTNAFTSALETGKVTQATLNQLTSQGIPIQEELARKYGVSRDAILQMAKDGKISVQSLTDVLVDMGNKGIEAGEKPKSAFDQFTVALGNTATAVGSVASALLSVLAPAIDTVILKATQALNILTETINTELLRTQIQAKTGKIISPEKLRSIETEAMSMAARRFPSQAKGRQLAAGAGIISPQAQAEFQVIREQLIRNELQRFGYESGMLKAPKSVVAGQIGKITAPSQITPSTKASKQDKGVDQTARKAQELKALLEQLKEQVKIETKSLELQDAINFARSDGNEKLVAFLQVQEKYYDLDEKAAKLKKDLYAGEIKSAEFKLRNQLLEIERKKVEIQEEQRLNEVFRERYGLTNSIIDAARQAREAAFGQGLGGAGTFRTDLNLMPDLTGGVLGGEYEKVKAELEELIKIENQVAVAAQGIGEAFGTSIKGLVSGSMTAQQALANFFQSIADQFADMAAQMIAKWVQMQILGIVKNFFPGSSIFPGGVGDFSGAFGAGGPTFNPGFAFGGFKAAGGPVTGKTPYVVGERGPELFVPGSNGTIVPNSQLGGMGGDVSVVVNVDAKGTSAQGDPGQAKALGSAISAAVQAEIVKQQRPGGLLAGTR